MWFLLCIPLGWSPQKQTWPGDFQYFSHLPQGSSTHWSVCPKATLSKCAAEMGRGTLLIFVDKADMAKHWRLTTLEFFFLQGTLSAHGGVLQIHRLISKVRRCSIFSLGKLGEPRLFPAVHDETFPGGLAIWGGKSLPFSAVFSIATPGSCAQGQCWEAGLCWARYPLNVMSSVRTEWIEFGTVSAIVFRGSLQKIIGKTPWNLGGFR